jgi:multidrug efflux pump subunit AcrA (membrane-fusion protein)
LIVDAGKAVKRNVKLGSTSDTQAVVLSGVKPGETIIAERNLGIVDGIRVTPTMMPSAKPTAHP